MQELCSEIGIGLLQRSYSMYNAVGESYLDELLELECVEESQNTVSFPALYVRVDHRMLRGATTQ